MLGILNGNRWKSHYKNNVSAYPYDMFKQVDKTVNGMPVDLFQMELIEKAIVEGLSLSQKDQVLDLCCGNGIVTDRISKNVKNIV